MFSSETIIWILNWQWTISLVLLPISILLLILNAVYKNNRTKKGKHESRIK